MRLYSKKEASKKLNISERTLDRRIAFSEIGIVKNGRLVQVTEEELLAYVHRNFRGGHPA